MSDPGITGQTMNDLGQPIGLPLSWEGPAKLPERTILTGRYCTLEPLSRAHAQGLFNAFREDAENRIWTYLPNGPYDSLAEYEAWTETAVASEDPLFLTILIGEEPLGHATYLRIDPPNGVIEIGFINLAPRLQRTRAATEFQYLMMAHAFDDLGYRRYEWKCDALNAPSRRAAKRLGFTYEGTFRQATHYKGRNRDTAWFSVIDSEWPEVKARFERWLDPGNFDAAGLQKTSL